jgi:hypothetical protein
LGRVIVIVIMLPVLYLAAILAASEMGGEVVVIETLDPNGRSFETSVWVADFDRGAWLRGGSADSVWVGRLRAQPEVFMTRDGERAAYRAQIIDGLVKRVNLAMRDKYGLADRLVTTIHDPEKVVAIRLDRR